MPLVRDEEAQPLRGVDYLAVIPAIHRVAHIFIQYSLTYYLHALMLIGSGCTRRILHCD